MGGPNQTLTRLPARLVLGLDADGGDDTAAGRVGSRAYEGVARFVQEFPEIRVKVAGHPERLDDLLLKFKSLSRVEFLPAPAHVESDGRIAGKRQDTALFRLLKEMKSGGVHGMLTCASNIAVMTYAQIVLDRIPGMDSIPILAEVPTLRGSTHALDVGATIDCTADQLVQFTKVGAAYVSAVRNVKYPNVALAANTRDVPRTSRIIQQAHAALGTMTDIHYLGPLNANYCIEGRFGGKNVDLVVTDGLVGNVFIKSVVAGAKIIGDGLKEELSRKWWAKPFAALLANATRNYVSARNDEMRQHYFTTHQASSDGLRVELAKLPSKTGWFYCTDVGAQPDCTPATLSRIATIGAQYSRNEGIPVPRVGLLSNGEEDKKGNALIKETLNLLRHVQDAERSITLVGSGNIEPRHCLEGLVDVAVADGHLGAVFKDSYVAGARLAHDTLIQGLDTTPLGFTGMAFKRALQSIAAPLSKSIFNGALAPGLCVRTIEQYSENDLPKELAHYTGGLFKGHGDSDSAGFYHGLRRLAAYLEADTTERIAVALERTKFI
jgi:glycerol-3-phosphate acyltransferase PlsX